MRFPMEFCVNLWHIFNQEKLRKAVNGYEWSRMIV